MSNKKHRQNVQTKEVVETSVQETVETSEQKSVDLEPTILYGMTTLNVQDEEKDFSSIRKELTEKFGSVTSPKIRYLRFVLNYSRTDTKDILRIRYQHVRNVELMPLKRDIS